MPKPVPVFALLLASILTGCAVGPDHRVPVPPAPAAFRQALPVTSPAGTTGARWWKNFRDPVLDELVDAALAHNHNLRIARARLAEARALRRGTRWDLAPSLTARGAVDRQKPGSAPVTETWSAGFDAAWEIDLFGRNRRRDEAAVAQAGATEADFRATQVSLLAELAASYLSLRHAETSLALVQRQADSVRHSLDIVRRRIDAGRGTLLDTARLEALWHETRSLQPALEREAIAHRHRLAVIIGRAPGEFEVPAGESGHSPAVAFAPGSPAEFLRRRPDVQSAERNLAAATAMSAADVAAFFPRVGLSGLFQFTGLSAGSLGDSGNRGWQLAPGLVWELLDYGRLRARLQVSRARADAALASYERSVLLALEDAENQLARYRAAVSRRESLEARHAAEAAGLAIARRQLDAGALDPLAHLDVERASLVSAREAITARHDQQMALVGVYKAFAGGFEAW